jgi:hypothetical protein
MTFSQHCIVELFGHSRIAGLVTEETIGGATFIRVDVPKTSKRESLTKFYGATAIYAITPTDQETAQLAAESFSAAPIETWRINDVRERLLTPPDDMEQARREGWLDDE